MPFREESSGTVIRTIQNYGFIRQDSGEPDLFFMNLNVEAFGGVCPPRGTRVMCRIGTSTWTGLPIAENIVPEVL